MRRRWPVLLPAFLLSSGASFAGVYHYRTSQEPGTLPAITASTTTPVETTSAPETSLLEVPETSVVESTVPVEATSPPETTVVSVPETTPLPTVGPDNGILQALPAGVNDRRQLDVADECGSMSPTGSAVDCGTFTAERDTLRWVRYDDGGARLDVLTTSDPDSIIWDVKLRSKDLGDSPSVRTGTGLAPLVVLARRSDANRTLELDVVEGADPGVSLHLALLAGQVQVTADHINAWKGVLRDGDPAGSPSQFDEWVIVRDGGGWKVASAKTVSPDLVPS